MLQLIKTVFNQWYTALLAVSSFVATVWGLSKAIGALRRWIKAKFDKHKQHQGLQDKIMQTLECIDKKIDDLQRRITDNDDCTCTMMLEKMMDAYHYYVLSKNPIPLDVRTALCVMFDEYVKSGRHNHVPADFKQKIMECQVK